MPTFKPTTRSKKEYNTVYIRINHRGDTDYIKTAMSVHKSAIRKGEIADHTILANCALKIKSYVDKINNTNVENWTIQELKKYLIDESGFISFSKFARMYADKMEVNGRGKPAENYRTALNSFERHFKKDNIYFSDITSKEVRKWIESLSASKRAKELYPVIIRKLFDEGCLEYNDYDREIIKIKNQPFKAIKIPKSDIPIKRSVEAEVVREILNVTPATLREELAHDFALLVLYLAGINAIDLYNLEKNELKEGKMCYNRTKTKNERKDKAYIEISVPKEINSLIDKYKGKLRLFDFKERYSTSADLSKAINIGLKSLCEKVNKQIDKDNEKVKDKDKKRLHIPKITVYWLRHTWATVAQNKCGASTELVAFCLNHASAHKTTEGYIKKDFTPIDVLNRKVLDYIFGKEC